MRRVNLLRAHGSPTGHLYVRKGCRCAPCVRWIRDYNAAYRAEHREENRAYANAYRAAHPGECRARVAAWRAAHPEERRAYGRNRRSRERGAEGTHTAADVAAQYLRQHGRCYWCKGKLDEYHTDHVIPLILGGSNGPENLVIACPHCNVSKQAKHPMVFAGVLF